MDRPHLRRLLLAWAALLVLLAATAILAYMPLGRASLPVAIGIAIVKGLVILAIFMELRSAAPLLVIFASAGFLWLAILLALPAIDYRTRRETPATEGLIDRAGLPGRAAVHD